MANLCPALPTKSLSTPGIHAELELLESLERGLSDAYTLFHSVDWSQGAGAEERHGEIDIVVLNRAGDVLLIEVKSGEVEFRDGLIFKAYGQKSRNIIAQSAQQYSAFRSRMKDAGLDGRLSHLLVLPDVNVQSETINWPRERIVDSSAYAEVVSTVAKLLGPGILESARHSRTTAFLENRFQVAPDVSALVGRIARATTRLSAGLATWVPRINAPSGVIRVIGTAGSGKTQLALRMLRDADAAGRKAAYICFNRALADHISRVAPVRTSAETFHEFALRLSRNLGRAVDFQAPDVFAALASHCAEVVQNSEPDLDLIVLDEVQDLQPGWVEAMLSRLRPGGEALLLEDPEQQLYTDRVPFDIDGAVTVTSHENFRSPRALVGLINLLRLTDTAVEPLSATKGEPPDPLVYSAPEQIAAFTEQAIERCIERGFALEDIAVVSLRGRETSVLQGLDRLGRWTLRRFTGRFDEGGGALWTRGQLLIDSVRRFKGQSAQAVVLTECDLESFDTIGRRMLFVGLTRARIHLEWVISHRTAKLLENIASASAA